MDSQELTNANRRRGDNLRLLENIDVKLTVEVGATTLKIRDLIRLNEGSVIELNRLAGEQLDIFVNGASIAKGEIVTPEKRLLDL